MIKKLGLAVFSFILCSCYATKSRNEAKESTATKVENKVAADAIPACLAKKIKMMAANPTEGSPRSIVRYNYHGKTVYYMKAPCCDKFNIVFDSACNVLGYPDGGFTGRGDGSMPDFRKEATNKKILWEISRGE